MRGLYSFVLLAIVAGHGHAAFQQTPTLGYNTYNYVACSPTEAVVRDTINALADKGFVAAGYNIFQVDCGWQARDNSRNSAGAINVNTNAFPNGIKPLSDLAASKGLKWGMYSDAGVRSCDTTVPSPNAGSLGHEAADAQQFKSWNTYTVKYDNCYADGAKAENNAPKAPRTDFVSRFSPMTKALQDAGIEGELICQWGVPFRDNDALKGPVDWAKGLATSFRLSDDISDDWGSVQRIYNQAIYIANTGKTGPGFHADADLLEVGNKGLTLAEQQFHFAYWAMVKSALMISTDVVKLSKDAQNILLNKGLIRINQDALGKPIKLVQRFTDDYDLHSGPLSNGDVAVLALNLQNAGRTLKIDFDALGISSADVTDLYTGSSQQGAKSYSAKVDKHGVIALRLSNVARSTAAKPSVNWIEAESGTTGGKANLQSCSGCSGGSKVGNVGQGSANTLTLNNVSTSGTTATLLFDYVNAEIGFLGGTSNERRASISVNGGAAQTVSFPVTGYNWDADVGKNYRVQLSGFKVGGGNTIVISRPDSSFAPDFDRIGVLAA
ncbi:hypothetical protein ACQY0O_007228 [Thecaphora frezii]